MTSEPSAPPAAAPALPAERNLSMAQSVRMVRRWIRKGQPAAAVRFGEGEGRLLTATPAHERSIRVAMRKLRKQTGRVYSPRDVLEIRARVLSAFDEADIVGLRGGSRFSEEHKEWVRRLEELYAERVAQGRRPAYIGHSLMNNALRDELPRLLAGQERVSAITCRDLAPVLRERFGVPDVRVYPVPSQYVMRAVDDEYEAALHDTPIWPDHYHELFDSVTVRQPGEIFLIGAGVFGKELCVRVKALGGIGLDMGSTLDGLAGKVTRGPGRPEFYGEPAPPAPPA